MLVDQLYSSQERQKTKKTHIIDTSYPMDIAKKEMKDEKEEVAQVVTNAS